MNNYLIRPRKFVRFMTFSISLALLGPYQLAAGDDSPTQCVVGAPSSERLAISSIAGVPASFKPRRSRYVKEISRSHVVIDVRRQEYGKQNHRISIAGALIMGLHEVKAKQYLKNKRLVLVGDGLDDYFIEKEIGLLELAGFNSVKILEYGIPALIETGKLSGDVVTSFSLRVASAEKLLGGAIGSGETQNFVFVNLGDPNAHYSDLQLRHLDMPFDGSDGFYRDLYAYVETEVEKNKNLRIVFVHDNPNSYNQLIRSPKMFDMLGLWFMKGGNVALAKLNQKLEQTLIASQSTKVACAR